MIMVDTQQKSTAVSNSEDDEWPGLQFWNGQRIYIFRGYNRRK